MMHKKNYFIILCFLTSIFVNAQKSITPEWITIEHGLSQGYVSSIIQDEDGFLWMGTKNGLDRYDGEQFKNLSEEIKPPYDLKSESVISLHNGDGFILLGTESGVSLYQKNTKRFFSIELPGYPETLEKKPSVLEIVKDNSGNYWLGEIISGVLYKLSFSDDFYKNITSPDFQINNISVKKIELKETIGINYMCLFKDRLTFFTYETVNGKLKKVLNAMNVNTLEIEKLDSRPFKLEANTFWYKSFKGSLLYANSIDKVIYIYENSMWRSIKTDFNISTFSPIEATGKLLINSMDRQTLFFDDNILSRDEMRKADAIAMVEDSKVYQNDVLVDNSGVVWIATAGYGLMKITPRILNIETHFTGKSIYAKPFIFNKQDAYIGNPTTNENLFINKSQKINGALEKLIDENGNCFFTLDKDKQIWALVWNHMNYSIYGPSNTGELEKKIRLLDNASVISPIISYDDINNDLMVVCESFLFLYSIDGGQVSTFDFKDYIKGVTQRFDVNRTKDGSYWIGTNAGLLLGQLGDSGEMTFKVFNDESGIMNNSISTLLPDVVDENVLWIGTKGAGVYKLNITEESFTNIGIAEGLPNDVIYGILEDDEEKLWMSSNKGIIVYDKNTAEIENFDKSDGLQSSEFNTFAYNKGLDGTMYFGGINGLNIFHPDDFQDNPHLPKVWITGLEVNNERIDYGDVSNILTGAIENVETIELPYAKNSISLEFSALEYTTPEKNIFSYYMEGLEKEWIHTTTDNKANYLSVPPGNYTFKIKAANGDGIWNRDIKTLKVIVHSPWYRMNLAYVLYSVFLLALLWGFVKLREERIKKVQQIEKSVLENKLLKTEIAYKQKDLTDFASAISENQKWGDFLLESIKGIRESKGRTKGKYFDQLEENIKNKTFIEKNRVGFQDRIDLLNNQFYQTILAQYPNLSKTDLRLCTLIRLDLSTNDIAVMQNITSESVYKSRKRLRKKLNISPDIDLNVFLKQL